MYPDQGDSAILKSKTCGFAFGNGWWAESECPWDLTEAERTLTGVWRLKGNWGKWNRVMEDKGSYVVIESWTTISLLPVKIQKIENKPNSML